MGLITIINKRRGIDPDAQAYFNSVSTPLSANRKLLINTLVTTLKNDGNWNKLDRLFIFANEAQDQGLVSLVNPTSTAATAVNSPTFTADQGFTGNGTTSYVNLNYNPAINNIVLSQNSASIGLYSRTNSAIAAYDIGNSTSSSSRFFSIASRWSDGNNYSGAFQNTETTTALANSTGLFAQIRTASNAVSTSRNGVQINSGSNVSTSPTSVNVLCCCISSSGTPTYFSTRNISVAFIGSGEINILTFYNSIQTYMTSLGTQV